MARDRAGIVIPLVLRTVAALAGNAPTVGSFVAELAQKISWSAIVCTGVSVGRAAGKQPPALTGALRGVEHAFLGS